MQGSIPITLISVFLAFLIQKYHKNEVTEYKESGYYILIDEWGKAVVLHLLQVFQSS